MGDWQLLGADWREKGGGRGGSSQSEAGGVTGGAVCLREGGREPSQLPGENRVEKSLPERGEGLCHPIHWEATAIGWEGALETMGPWNPE